mmetsp:Transcript_88838/g.162856  ORF Transcript_88838/g.162856 Transcript_88838/m.162856 type:complete len:841 (+) Transcript_88838:98-2620(+)
MLSQLCRCASFGLMALLVTVGTCWRISPLPTSRRGQIASNGKRSGAVNLQVTELSRQMKDMRTAMAEDEQSAALISALRGTNLNDDDAAASGTKMQVVEMQRSVGDDSLPLEYDPEALAAYFKKRPVAVLTRLAQVAGTAGSWAVATAFSALQGKLTPGSDAEVAAVAGLRQVLVSLGPFYIKLGQALSIRPDILSPQAMVQLQQLCDKVPPFDSKIAMETIREELGGLVEDFYSKITEEPVAAASLGQVYKATLKSTGDEVAVKVQRPFVLETVSLDLYLARSTGVILRQLDPEGSKRLDIVSLLDEFAANFYRELDYELECANGIRLAEEMRVLPRVKIPKNYPEFTARRVHTAEWVEGEKLSQSTADDVGELVNLGVITYLTQLLETGFFHADPHPGNMLRAPDGQLVILDFGLMTEVTEDQRYGMIEAIAHLINRDYENIGDDFVNMDFIPRGVDTRPIVPALARVFEAALAGGGAKSINFQELAADLAEITYKFPFRIPPYSALIIRAVSVLEGIALVGNPQFAIIDEAYPYISRRLLTDDTPRMRAALRYMVYGSSGVFDVDRLIDLLQALEKFVAVRDEGDGTAFKKDGMRNGKYLGQAGDAKGTKKLQEEDGAVARSALDAYRAQVQEEQQSVDSQVWSGAESSSSQASLAKVSDQQQSTQAAEDNAAKAREALQFFFSKDGEIFRGFLLEEVVRAADALSRDALAQLTVTPAAQVLDRLPDPFGVKNVFNALSPPLTEKDQKVVESIRKLTAFFLGDLDLTAAEGSAAPTSGGPLSPDAASLEQARALLPVLQENQVEMREFGLQIVSRLTELQTSRALDFLRDRVAVSAR